MNGWPARILLALVIAFPLASLAADPPKCRLVQVAEWPVRFRQGLPVIEGSINGKTVGVLLDTGSYASLVTKAAAEKLELATRGTSEWMFGLGGASRVFLARIEELRLGGAVRSGLRVRVGGERPIPGVDFILGDDLFSAVDLEFEYARSVVRLFDPLDCKGAGLAYWGDALELPMVDEKKIVIPINVNGRQARAMLDSGASASLVSLSFAEKLGITPKTPGVLPAGCSGGIGADLVHSFVARFDVLALAGETIRDPRLLVAEIASELEYSREPPPDLLLGTDFLRTHHVLVSRSQRKVYFSYTGGQVFPATPALDCDERMKGKTPGEALAAYDQAIGKNPADIAALLNRASQRARGGDAAGALSDLDAAIRIEPNNAVALGARSGVRFTLKDYDGALADSKAALDNGMRTAQAYAYQGRVRRALGDPARAIDEYDDALKLDPRHQGALRSRGLLLFNAGRFEAAERDFAALLDIRPNAIDAIWVSLARVRRGLDGRAALEQGAATLKEGEWPAPILQFLLDGIDRDALLAAARADETKLKGRECEARLYTAEHLIALGREDEARPLLEAARDECPRDYIEYDAAVAELRR